MFFGTGRRPALHGAIVDNTDFSAVDHTKLSTSPSWLFLVLLHCSPLSHSVTSDLYDKPLSAWYVFRVHREQGGRLIA